MYVIKITEKNKVEVLQGKKDMYITKQEIITESSSAAFQEQIKVN